MNDLKTIFDPPSHEGSVDDLWERGRRARRRRRAIPRVAVAVAAVVVVGVVVLVRSSEDGSSDVVAGPSADTAVDDTSRPSTDGGATRTYPTAERIRELTVSGGLTVEVVAGTGPVTITAPPEILDKELAVSVEAGHVVVERDQGAAGGRSDDVHVTVPAPSLNRIEAAGGVQLTLATPITSQRLNLALSGGVNLDGSVAVETLTVDASGGVNATIGGTATTSTLTAAGGVNLGLASLTSRMVHVTLSDGTSVTVHATQSIEGSVTDGSALTHEGTSTISVEVDSSSVIRPAP